MKAKKKKAFRDSHTVTACMTHWIPMVHTHFTSSSGQRANNGCHEGSQHWFLQAKPLTRVMPGRLLLLLWFSSVRCPFQTEHHHLENRKSQWAAAMICSAYMIIAEGLSNLIASECIPFAGLSSCLLMWLLASFFWFSLTTFWLVTPGMTGRWAGGVWAMGELRRSSRNLRS